MWAEWTAWWLIPVVLNLIILGAVHRLAVDFDRCVGGVYRLVVDFGCSDHPERSRPPDGGFQLF